MLSNSLDEERSQALQAILPACDIDDYGFTSLHLAVLGLSHATVEEALRDCSPLTIDVEDTLGRTDLWWAAQRSDVQAVELLLRHHADPQKSDTYQYSPIFAAFQSGSLPCVKLLLDCGIDVNRKNGHGMTPLMYLAARERRSKDLNLLDLLLQHRPVIDTQEQNGDSALLLALQHQNYDVATHLVQRGADVHLQEIVGYNALSVAILYNIHPLVELLLDHKADHLGTMRSYGTLLHLVAEEADTKTLGILTNKNLASRNVRRKRSNGQTAEDVARSCADVEWQKAFFAFIRSIDDRKPRVSPFGVSPLVDNDRTQTNDSDGEEDIFVDALE